MVVLAFFCPWRHLAAGYQELFLKKEGDAGCSPQSPSERK
jgi:hypothetical protein